MSQCMLLLKWLFQIYLYPVVLANIACVPLTDDYASTDPFSRRHRNCGFHLSPLRFGVFVLFCF